jgi:hypothetical protein
MEEIKRRFKLMCSEKKNENNGDYINLAKVVVGRNYKPNDIRKSFLKLVSRNEYDSSERGEYIDYLCQITLKIR